LHRRHFLKVSDLPPKADMNTSIYDHVGLTVASDNRRYRKLHVTPLLTTCLEALLAG